MLIALADLIADSIVGKFSTESKSKILFINPLLSNTN